MKICIYVLFTFSTLVAFAGEGEEIPSVSVSETREESSGLDSSSKDDHWISGFVDVQHLTTGAQGGAPADPVFLNDSALYLQHSIGSFKFQGDLPLQARTWAGIQVPWDKMQAYVDYTFADRWRSRVGRFDSPYGFEMNDSADNLMSNQGPVYDAFAPYTHTGWMGSYLGTGFEVHVIASDMGYVLPFMRQDQAEQSVGEDPVPSPAGGQLGIQTSLSPGVLFTQVGDASQWMPQLMLSQSISKWKIDLEADWIQRGESREVGFFLLNSYEFSENTRVGLRLESVRSWESDEDTGREFQVTTGIQQRVLKGLSLKGSYTYNTLVESHFLHVAGLYQF
jgi:hypothetical protein